jgi:starch phosphorylase
VPAAASYRARSANLGALGETMACWQRVLDKEWATLKLGRVGISRCDEAYEFTIEVALGAVDPQSLRIELYADPQGGGEAFRRVMTRAAGDADCEGRSLYMASAPTTRAAGDYCARILPAFPGVSVPLENPRVLWER